MIIVYDFFSDFHYGDGSLADNFRKRFWLPLLTLINKLLALNHVVVFVGDTCEALQFNYKDIKAAYPDLDKLLEKCTVIWGNHDLDIAKHFPNIQVSERVVLCDSKVEGFHGHQFDQPMGRGLVRFGLKCWAFIERILGRKLNKWFESDPISPQDPRYVGNKSEYVKKGLEWAEIYDREIVVNAHTHSPGIFRSKDGRRVLLNTGTCKEGRQMYATVEYDTELKKIVYYDVVFVK